MATPARKITQWSYSRWKTYTSCPRKAKYCYIDRLPQPSSPAMDRGTAIHKMAEDFLRGTHKAAKKELRHFKAEFTQMRVMGAKPELEMAFSKTWKPTGWFDAETWVRIKVDALAVRQTGQGHHEVLVIDFKTGKKYDDHNEQLSLYALGGMLANDLADKVRTQLWYLDSGEVLEDSYNYSQLEALKSQWIRQTKPMLSDTKFAPLPSRSCLWCPFSKAKGGPCEF